MSSSDQKSQPGSKNPLSPQAQRALDEAENRRIKADTDAKSRTKEINGRDGPEATRYGDWEKNGIISDF